MAARLLDIVAGNLEKKAPVSTRKRLPDLSSWIGKLVWGWSTVLIGVAYLQRFFGCPEGPHLRLFRQL